MPYSIQDRLNEILDLDPDAPAIEVNGEWSSWGALRSTATQLEGIFDQLRVPQDARIALVLRSDSAVVGAILGVLMSGRTVVSISPSVGAEGLARELSHVDAACVVSTPEDATRIEALGPNLTKRRTLIAVSRNGSAWVQEAADIPGGPSRVGATIAIEMLTSGTTGPPKRIGISYDELERSLGAARQHYGKERDTSPALRSGIAIISAPLVHMSGMFRMLLNLCAGRRIVLMPRFVTDEFVRLVQRHRPLALSIVPAALRMVLESDPPSDAFDSVKVVTSGTAPLPVELQVAFEERFDVAVLPSYGATEFAGGVAGWTLPLHQEWASRKRGSVGRPQPGREVRIVDPDGGDELPADTQGQIQVRTQRGDWIETTDFGRVDRDGFVWIEGRSDDTIIRGGFKVIPSEIVEALRLHPAVLDAGVTGLSDARLGAVPGAAVELRVGAVTTAEELLEHLRQHLAPYKVPADLVIVSTLPRTASLKIDQPELRRVLMEVRS